MDSKQVVEVLREIANRTQFEDNRTRVALFEAIRAVSSLQINEYQNLALRTANSLNGERLIVNGALGLCGESGEVADIIKKWQFQGHEPNKDKIIEELGDVCWYIATLSEGIGSDLEEVMAKNILKLKMRYPEGFEVDKSVNREE